MSKLGKISSAADQDWQSTKEETQAGDSPETDKNGQWGVQLQLRSYQLHKVIMITAFQP